MKNRVRVMVLTLCLLLVLSSTAMACGTYIVSKSTYGTLTECTFQLTYTSYKDGDSKLVKNGTDGKCTDISLRYIPIIPCTQITYSLSSLARNSAKTIYDIGAHSTLYYSDGSQDTDYAHANFRHTGNCPLPASIPEEEVTE